MNRFWHRYTGPFIRAAAPRRILEIGADLGWNTQYLLGYCRESGCVLDIVDTRPSDALRSVLASFSAEHYGLHVGKSVETIPALAPPDIVMLDGDHNWRTVFAELGLLLALARSHGSEMPIVLAHDCAWPYARRDMYYNPDDFSEAERRPYAYKGILPGVAELTDDGINGRLANALDEGGPENGVLTAIEDFITANDGISLWTLPFHNGLGILVPEARLSPVLKELIEGFYTGEAMLDACKALEADGMQARAQTIVTRTQLERRTATLKRARHLLEVRERRIAELEAELAASRTMPEG